MYNVLINPKTHYSLSNAHPSWQPSGDANLLQNILEANSWSTWNDISPYFLFNSLLFWQNAPIWTMFCLEPLEIVDLIPMILGWFF